MEAKRRAKFQSRKIIPSPSFRKPVHARAAELGRNERNKGDEKGQHAFRFAWRGGGSFLAIVFVKIV